MFRFKDRGLSTPLIAATVGTAAAPALAGSTETEYIVEELPRLGTIVTASTAESINNEGVVTGMSADDTLTQRAVKWTDGAITELDMSSEPDPSNAADIAPGGTIAGWSHNNATTMATVWENTTPTFFDPLPGHIASQANDVNDSGLLIGWSIDTIGDRHAVKWDSAAPVELADEPSIAIAVNGSGQIVGRQDMTEGRRALLWEGEVMQELPGLGFDISSPSDINDNGVISGASVDGDTQMFHAVIWEGDPPTVTDLGRYQGNPTSANGLNNNGTVVGDATISPDETRALMWDDNGEVANLNDLIAPDSDWVLHSAMDVNDNGVIVGFGFRQGQPGRRAFKLTPVAPEDFNADGAVDVADLLALLGAWGPCVGCPEDLNDDDVVDVNDLLQLLAAFSP